MEKKVASESAVLALDAVVATLLMVPAFGGAAVPAATTAAGLGSNSCTRTCGNISIRYPFGVEPGCYHAAGFNLTCDDSYQPPKLFLGNGTVQVLDISVEHSTVRINSNVVVQFLDDGPKPDMGPKAWGLGLPKSGPYFLSESASMLVVLGCGTQVSIQGGPDNSLVSSCTAVCPVFSFKNGSCTGINRCQASIVLGYSSYTIHRLVRLAYKLYFFSQRTVFFLITNQPTVFSTIANQPSEQGTY